MAVFLGLDCGGSSCRAIAADESGAILHQGQAGPANLASTPPGKIHSHVVRAAQEGPEPDFVCGCFAGLLVSDDRIRAVEMLHTIFPNAAIRAEPDYFAALMASDDADVCIIAGTGSLVCSRKDGAVVKSGGRGYILGDVGSAYQYGRAAMLHFLDVGPKNCSEALSTLVFTRFGSHDESAVLARLYRGGLPAAQLAKLAPAFGKDVRAGIPYAVRVLEEQTIALAKIVQRHIETHFESRNELRATLAGGLWDGATLYRNALETKLNELMPKRQIEFHRISRPPVHGAVQLARELAR